MTPKYIDLPNIMTVRATDQIRLISDSNARWCDVKEVVDPKLIDVVSYNDLTDIWNDPESWKVTVLRSGERYSGARRILNDHNLYAITAEMLITGAKISAIKLLRSILWGGLKETKDVVDEVSSIVARQKSTITADKVEKLLSTHSQIKQWHEEYLFRELEQKFKVW